MEESKESAGRGSGLLGGGGDLGGGRLRSGHPSVGNSKEVGISVAFVVNLKKKLT